MVGICKFLVNDGNQGAMMEVSSALGARLLVVTMKWC